MPNPHQPHGSPIPTPNPPHQLQQPFKCLAAEFGRRLPSFSEEHLRVRLVVGGPLEACSPKASAAGVAAAAAAAGAGAEAGAGASATASSDEAPAPTSLPYAVLAARGTCPFGPKSANVAAAYVGSTHHHLPPTYYSPTATHHTIIAPPHTALLCPSHTTYLSYPNVSVVLIINTASDEPLAMGAEFDTASPPPPVVVLSVGNAVGEDLLRRARESLSSKDGGLVLDLSDARGEPRVEECQQPHQPRQPRQLHQPRRPCQPRQNHQPRQPRQPQQPHQPH